MIGGEVVCGGAFTAAHPTRCAVRVVCALMLSQQGVALGEGVAQVVAKHVGVQPSYLTDHWVEVRRGRGSRAAVGGGCGVGDSGAPRQVGVSQVQQSRCGLEGPRRRGGVQEDDSGLLLCGVLGEVGQLCGVSCGGGVDNDDVAALRAPRVVGEALVQVIDAGAVCVDGC